MHPRHRLTVMVAVVVLALAACTSPPSTDPTSTSSTTDPSGSAPSGSVTVTSGAGAATSPSTGALMGRDTAVQPLTWQSCPPAAPGAASTDGFECSTAVVPMDHADPTGETFTLAVIKAPARDPAGRIGTLFWNPGGPSDAGTQYLPASIQGFPDRVRDSFDIVSWDPRGMGGGTTPVVQCFDSQQAEDEFLVENTGGGSVPVTDDELATFTAGKTAFNQACVDRNGDLLAHVSTADNARDLDLLRQAVGDEQMNYYGTSYGTFLGATYLNMYPDRIRSAVLDGAVFPTAWSDADGDLSTFIRIGSDVGAAATVTEFINQCGAVDTAGCAFSAGSPEATQAKWTQLLDLAKSGLTVEGQTIDDRAVVSYVQSSIYIVDPIPGFGRFPGWPAVGEFLQQLWETTQTPSSAGPVPSGSAESAAPSGDAAPAAGGYLTSGGRQLSVICGESPNPTTDAGYTAQAKESFARAGVSAWPFVAYCAGWTVKAADPYLGPWDNPTSAPVLVLGNTFDPATPYASSERMAQELADGHFLRVNGFGHTELLNPSTCAQDFVADYLIDGTLPPAGSECTQDKGPFDQR